MRALAVVLALFCFGCSPSGEALDTVHILARSPAGRTVWKLCDGTTALYIADYNAITAVPDGCPRAEE